MMYDNPDATIASMSGNVGVNVAAINKHIKQLVNKGYVQRAQNGDWRLIITPSI